MTLRGTLTSGDQEDRSVEGLTTADRLYELFLHPDKKAIIKCATEETHVCATSH